MRLDDFASKHRLRVRRAEVGDHIIAGKLGHIYQHDAETLGLLFMPNRPRLWSHAKRKLEAGGFTIWQDGDHEGSALFDPTNTPQAQLAVKVVGAKRKRRQSARQLANLRKTPARRPSGAPESTISVGSVLDTRVG